MPKLTLEKVDRQYLLELELTTDLAYGQFANFAMALINLFVYKLINMAVLRLLDRSNPFSKLFGQSYS